MSLRDKLVAYRKRVADGKPAFCVFDNKTIDAIVDAKPASVAAFGRVAGIGPTKREKYGEDVARICAAPPLARLAPVLVTILSDLLETLCCFRACVRPTSCGFGNRAL